MFKAVIFDMDGVIIDSEPMHRIVNDELFKSLGFFVSDEEYMGFVGTPNSSMWNVLKGRRGLKQSIEELLDLQLEELIRHFSNNIKEPIEGVVEFIDSLRENGITVGLASSSHIELIGLVLSKLDISDRFTAVVSGENIKRGKPEPDIFLAAAKLLEVEPEVCLVIEDSANGTRAAKAAGMKCIGYRNPNSGNQDLSLSDFITDSFYKLKPGLVKKLFE